MSSLCWTWFRYFVELNVKTHTKFSITTTKTSTTQKNLHRGFLQTSAAILIVIVVKVAFGQKLQVRYLKTVPGVVL